MRTQPSHSTNHRTIVQPVDRRAPMRRGADVASRAVAACVTAWMVLVATGLPAVAQVETEPDRGGPTLDAALDHFPVAERQTLRTAARAAVRAGADGSILAEILERARERETGAAWATGVLVRARRLGEARLPVAPVLDRYLQGLAKGVAPARIDAVAQRFEERLEVAAGQIDRVFAGTQVEERQRLAMIDHAGYALGAGIPDEALAATLEMVAGARLGLGEARGPVIALGCLGAAGLEPGRCRELVQSAWQHGFRGEAIEQLATAVGALGRQRHDALPGVVDALLARLERGDRRQTILADLERQRHGDGPGHHPPGTAPGEDPGDMRGPGGSPDDPGRQHPHGHGAGGETGHGGPGGG
jgi:hypothetical protein